MLVIQKCGLPSVHSAISIASPSFLCAVWRTLVPCTALTILSATFLIHSSPVDLIQLISDGIFPVKSNYQLTELYTDEEGLHITYDHIPIKETAINPINVM